MTILIADSQVDREAYRDFLPGYSLLFCNDSADMLQQLRASRCKDTRITLVILLWQFPGAARIVEALNDTPDVPFIVVDASGSRTTLAAALRHNASAAMWKPLKEESLLESVRMATGESQLTPLVNEIHKHLVGQERSFRIEVQKLARAILADDGNEPVLITGETGVGKEVAARAVHALGPRRNCRFVEVNAATIPPPLIESALFGHARGAFTDAKESHTGFFQECGNGILFLDEIGELETSMQAKLLRVIQERRFRTLKGDADIPFNGRLVLATNRGLNDESRFRSDLYHRVSTYHVHLPPLRERRNDWIVIMHYFLDRYAPGRGLKMSPETRAILSGYKFPGNVRELEKIVIHALSHNPAGEIQPHQLLPQVLANVGAAATHADLHWPEEWMLLPYKEAEAKVMQTFDSIYLNRALARNSGRQKDAAQEVGLDAKTFRAKLQKTTDTP